MRGLLWRGEANPEQDGGTSFFFHPALYHETLQTSWRRDAAQGVESFDIFLEEKRVVVRGPSLSPEAVVEKVAKTGKKTVRANRTALSSDPRLNLA